MVREVRQRISFDDPIQFLPHLIVRPLDLTNENNLFSVCTGNSGFYLIPRVGNTESGEVVPSSRRPTPV